MNQTSNTANQNADQADKTQQTKTRQKREPVFPGDSRKAQRIEQMIRVDHAGEYGAVAIYQGQRAVFDRLPSRSRIANQLEEMEADEQHHLDAFDNFIRDGRARPTLLMPIWKLAGYGLGVTTALLGEKAAHACTEAVESVIEQHYDDQVRELTDLGEDKLAKTFAQFRDEETAHKDLAVAEGAKTAAGYPLLSGMIKFGCRAAIAITQRI